MAAEDGLDDSMPRGKTKKKSALTKLVERKKRQVGASDVDSEYGSRVSLQDSKRAMPLEPEIIVERPPTSSGASCIPCKSAHSAADQDKPRPRPRRQSRSGPAEGGSGSVAMDTEFEGSGQGDWHSDPQPQGSGKAVPTDSTIYRFRNMRMAAEQADGADSGNKLQGPFIPKPPSTPRTPRSAVIKGEKRNHEPASSGEEPEVDPKRQTPGKNETDVVVGKGKGGESSSADINHKLSQSPQGQGQGGLSPSKFSSVSQDNADVAGETMDQLHSHYRQLVEAADGCQDSPLHAAARRDSSGSHANSSTPRSGRLAPLPPMKNPPPPLDADVSSRGLRTAYKADPSYRPATSSTLSGLRMRGSEGSGVKHMGSEDRLGSDNLSLSSASVMPSITTKEARSRSFLEGNVSSGTMSILGAEELERYFPDRLIHVFIGSWNMNELKAMSTSLNDFILPETCEYVQDIYVVGTQENEFSRKEWEIRLQETLGPSHVLFHSVSYGCLHLAIFIRRDLIWFCSVPEDDVVSLRAVSMVKTKGAIGISFSMFGTSFLFINCHLTSDRGSSKNKIRLLDYHRVTRELRLPHQPPGKQTHPVNKLADVTARFDCVFWCGDLNFRLERRRAAVEGKVTQMTDTADIPHFEELLGADQLSKYITEGKIFEGFQEGRINFQPTFKFDVNTDKYDSSSKMRIPSYTDRILFRSRKKNQISCLHYDAVLNIRVSDHRAVYAFFEASLRPGRDNIQMCAGQFDRDVYLEANKRRAQAKLSKGHKNSSVCALQ